LIASTFALTLLLAAAPAGRCVEIVETNDLHGHIAPERSGTGKVEGGLAWFGGYLRLLRQRDNPVLLLDSGDLFQGTLASNLSHGRVVIAAYDALGYTASTVGNHEFDFGRESPDSDLLAAIRHRLTEASFPFLAANMVDRSTGQRPAWKQLLSSEIVDAKGLRVGLIGLANPETPALTLPENVASLEFLPPAPVVIREAASLRKAGADLVVVVAHFGGRCEELGGSAGESSCVRGGQMQAMADMLHALPPGTIDLALAGHTHEPMANWIAGVPTLEASFGGKYFSWFTACAKPGGGLDRDRSTLRAPVSIVPGGSFLGKPVEEDPAIVKIIAPYLQAVEAEQERRVGPVLAAPLLRDRNSLSPLGALTAEALRRYAVADAAVINAGGIRADLPKGPLTYGALYQALPFENRAAVVRVTGQKLLEILSVLTRSGHGYPQVSGLTLAGVPGAWTGATFTGGRVLEADMLYRLATVDFLVGGGDGLRETMASLPAGSVERLEGAPVLREIVLSYLEKSALGH
jgi:5'-nucleotidase